MTVNERFYALLRNTSSEKKIINLYKISFSSKSYSGKVNLEEIHFYDRN